jgi:thioredoxin reductase
MAQRDSPHVAVLGAGPVGLEAALYARRLGLPVHVYERGRPGEYLRRWGHVRMFTPFGMNSTPLGRSALRANGLDRALPGDGDLHTGWDYLTTYLEPLSRCTALRDVLHAGTEVIHVSRRRPRPADGSAARAEPFLLLLRGPDGGNRLALADVVLDCTGTFGRHRWLGGDGLPVPGEAEAEAHISYHLEDMAGAARDRFAGRSVLVVGAGYSAATTVCALADLAHAHPATRTIWLTRDLKPDAIRRVANDPLPERDRLAARSNDLAQSGAGNIEFHPDARVEAIDFRGPDRGFVVTARVAGQTRTWDVDRLVANIGFEPDALTGSDLQADALADRRTLCGPAAIRAPEPSYFVLGSKSYGRNSDFLLRDGFEQVRAVFALFPSPADLDCHATN